MKFGVLASGAGTNLGAIFEYGLRPDLVMADQPCAALEIAKGHGVEAMLLDRTHFGFDPEHSKLPWRRTDYCYALRDRFKLRGIELVVMAGFNTILVPPMTDDFAGMIINTHPARLPACKRLHGRKVIEATLASGVETTGCTIHIATDEVDDDRFILDQSEVRVITGDTVESLWTRIKETEYRLYPQVIQKILNGKINPRKVMAQ